MRTVAIEQVCHGVEFGFDIAQTLWPAFVLKQALGSRVHIQNTCAQRFPEALWRQFSDGYVFDCAKPPLDRAQERPALKALSQCYRDGVISADHFLHMMDWSWCAPPTGRYVCFIPTLAERRGPVGGPYDRLAGGHSLPFDNWVRLKQLVNRQGYEVVTMGELKHTGMGKVDWSKLGDRFFLMQQVDDLVARGEYLWEQLKLMLGACFTLSMGGACAIAPVFGLPGICVDANWRDKFPGADTAASDAGTWVRKMSVHYLFPLWARLESRGNLDVLYEFDDTASLEQKFEITARWVEEKIIERLSGPVSA